MKSGWDGFKGSTNTKEMQKALEKLRNAGLSATCGFTSMSDEGSFHTCEAVLQETIDRQAIEIAKLRDIVNNHCPGRYYFK